MTVVFTTAFDDIVARYPAHTAVLTDGLNALTYADLQTRAHAIAAAIPAGSNGRIVAINITKSADYITAMLGCWYAGAAFMPLDPDLPTPRRTHMLAEAQPVAILTCTTCADVQGIPVIDIKNIDTLAQTTVTFTPTDTAYVIYTSGSTGQPKGVVVSHRVLVDVLTQQIELFQLTPDSRSLFYLSTGFDASVSDIGTALLAGATLCIESGNNLETAASLPALIAARGITYADLPPALLQLIDPAAMPTCLATICIGGEACPPAIIRRWAQDRRIVCVYGPTEATICTSASVCDADNWHQPLIGQPLRGITYMIADRTLKPCDDGELLIAGAALADGYLARADLTAQKFITINGTRWYRTGDHVRRDGNNIVFLGRIDRQFKWRGQLVEPEEIEQALRRITGISRAAVLRQTSSGHEQLAAHIECSDAPDDTTLRATLATELPVWMVPTIFIRHARMPLTATGKINTAALALTGSTTAAQNSAAFAPVTAQDHALLACWQRVLGHDTIPADVPFAALGGDSFAVLRLMLLAEEQGLRLSADFITRNPTIRAQARNLHASDVSCDAMTSTQLRDNLARTFPLPQAIGTKHDTPVTHALMTGATGFLGRRLLDLLLARTGWTFQLLMRDKSEAAALSRLSLDEEQRARVNIVLGDSAQEHLGVDTHTWHELSKSIDTIIHCAASVNMALSYDALKDANVRAAHSLLLLASEGKGKAKTIHHASTLSVFVGSDRNTGTVFERDHLEAPQNIYGGYAQSKWAAETLLLGRGHNSIYRLGLITGDTHTGHHSSHDFLRTFMAGIASLGCVPAGDHAGLMVDATPVDYAANMMAAGIMQNDGGIFHIANRRGFSLAQIIAALARAGHDIETVSLDEWHRRLNAQKPLSTEESAAVMALCRLLGTDAFARHRTMDLFQATDITFDMTHIAQTLGSAWHEPPAADDDLLDLYVRSFALRPSRAKKSAIA